MMKPRVNFVRGCFTQTEVNERTDDQPHHLVKKTIGFEFDGEQRAGIADTNAPDGAGGIVDRRSAISRERCKVVASREQGRRGRESSAIERLAHLPGPSAFQGRQYFTVPAPG